MKISTTEIKKEKKKGDRYVYLYMVIVYYLPYFIVFILILYTFYAILFCIWYKILVLNILHFSYRNELYILFYENSDKKNIIMNN